MERNLLIVDDNERVFQSLAVNFQRHGFTCLWAADRAIALDISAKNRLHAVLIDLSLGSESGLDVMEALTELHPNLPAVFISGFGTLEAAVSAMKMGAFDFLPKPLNFPRLLQVVNNAIAAMEGKAGTLEKAWGASAAKAAAQRSGANASPGLPEIVSSSPVMARLLEKAAVAAKSEIPVLITGESGTGKELLAEFMHAHSHRSERPLVRVNCSAINDALAESELFGHAKGAFTGAVANHRGYFEQADGGTLHLDEIGDMPAGIQAKLLRTLENSMIRAVGGIGETKVDVRLVASTNRDLAGMVAQGHFRSDLFYRINVLQLNIPPLRERREDIPVLLRHFLAVLPESGCGKRFSVEAERLLYEYPWPGNIREMKNIVKVCALLTPSTVIEAADLPQSLRNREAAAPRHSSASRRLEESEKNTIIEILKEVGGNRRNAAERLGISIRSLYYKLERHGIS